jgi:hypothetical protein
VIRRFAVLLACALAVLSYSPIAPAQTADADKTTARSLAKTGFDALDAKEYEKAVDLFTRADKLYYAPTILLGLARAQVALHKYVEGLETYQRIINEKLPDNANKHFKNAVKDARKEVVGLDEKIGWVTINVTGPDKPEVTVDGVAVPAAAVGVKRAVNPGEHVVEAKAQGYLADQQSFTVQAGGHEEIGFELKIDPNAEEPPEPVGSDDEAPGSTQKILAYVSLGVGGAALLIGAITGGIAMGKHGDLEDNCPNEQCPMAQESTLDAFNTTSTVSTVGFIAGGLLAATGVVLLLTAPSAQEPEAPTVSARFGLASVQATVRF